MKASIELVIFDCDGVLVDSEIIANTIMTESLRELGINFTLEETIARFMGKSFPSCEAEINQLTNSPIPEDFWLRLQAKTTAAFNAELKPVKDIEAAIRDIETPRCIASSGRREKIDKNLKLTGLTQYFENNIYSAAQVDRGKPFPDLFLFAAEQMGVAAEKCLVIEDSPYGVEAAIAANMTVLGYCERTSAELLGKLGATTFNQMADLPQLVRELNAN